MASTTTGPSLPTAVSQVATPANLAANIAVSGGVTWQNPDNVLAEGPLGALAILYTANSNHFSATLQGTGIAWKDQFGNPVTIPTTAIVTGITMTVVSETSGSGRSDSSAYGSYSLLGLTGAVSKGDAYPRTPWIEGTVTSVVRGNSNDLWGCPVITPAQLNSPSFGWAFAVNGTQLPGRGVDLTVYYVTLQVTYLETAPPPSGPGYGAGHDFAAINNVWGNSGNPPAAPTSLGATGIVDAVNLSWTGSVGAIYYNVYRGTSPGGESSTPIATGVYTTSYQDTTGTPGTTYYYTVKAISFGGASAASNEASATPSQVPTLVQSISGGNGNSVARDITMTLPSTPTPGNTLVFFVSAQNGNSITPPSGVTLQHTFSQGAATFWVYTRIAQSGDGKTWQFLFANIPTNFTWPASYAEVAGNTVPVWTFGPPASTGAHSITTASFGPSSGASATALLWISNADSTQQGAFTTPPTGYTVEPLGANIGATLLADVLASIPSGAVTASDPSTVPGPNTIFIVAVFG